MIEIRPAAAPSPSRSRWSTWTAAPHRVFFLPGVVQFVLALVLMAWEVAGRGLGFLAPPPWAVPPAWAHAYLLLFATFPWFLFGFGMTALPNWTGVAVPRARWLAAALPMIAGIAVFYAGLFVHPRLAAAGGLLQLAGWIAGCVALARMFLASPKFDAQALEVIALLGVGAFAVLANLYGIAALEPGVVRLAQLAGLWLFLLPIFLVVSHRLVPFFASRVIDDYAAFRPAFSLPFLFGACVLHFALEAADLVRWTWVADAPVAAWVGWLAWRWGLVGSFRARLLAMLHLSLVVLSAAMALHAAASLASLLGFPAFFGRGPQHLLAIGYFTAMTVGMVSRVSLGHSGRGLEADPVTWYGFLAIIAIGGVRAAADLAFVPGPVRIAAIAVASGAWIVILAAWAARFVPVYLSPRADGRPG